jgi:hypothetical protein
MAMAFFCPTNTTRRLPGVTPRVEKIGPAEPAGDERVNLGLVSGSADDPSGAQMVSTSISIAASPNISTMNAVASYSSEIPMMPPSCGDNRITVDAGKIIH